MGYHLGSKIVFAQVLCIALTLGLFFSFGLHAVQVPHAHVSTGHEHSHEPQSSSISLAEYMHVSDKKFLLLVFVVGTLLVTFLDVSRLSVRRLLLCASRYCAVLSTRGTERDTIFNYLDIFFGRGILHTKLH